MWSDQGLHCLLFIQPFYTHKQVVKYICSNLRQILLYTASFVQNVCDFDLSTDPFVCVEVLRPSQPNVN